MYATHDETRLAPAAATRRPRGALAAVIHAFAAWSDRRKASRIENKAIVALASLDAYLLRDIGVDRADLERLVREGRR